MSALSTPRAMALLLRRDLLLAYRRRAELINPLLFFVLIATLFPLGVGADSRLLQTAGPGIVWVAALLAALLSLDSVFRSDFEDGTLEQLMLSAHPVSLLVLAKVFAHWLVTGVPLILVSPLIGVLLSIPSRAMPVLVASLALGTPVLSLIGAVGVALTMGLRRAGIILSLLVLPLYVPVLIFASSAVDAASSGLPVGPQLYILAAMLVAAVSLAPVAAAASLRVSLS